MVFKRRHEFELADNALYMLSNVRKCFMSLLSQAITQQVTRITAPQYVPSQDDILQCRYRTTGIHEITFKYQQLTMRMIDVGGQRSERRKWLHVFDNVQLVLFVTSLSAYNKSDPDEPTEVCCL
jgi:hypothetical protein